MPLKYIAMLGALVLASILGAIHHTAPAPPPPAVHSIWLRWNPPSPNPWGNYPTGYLISRSEDKNDPHPLMLTEANPVLKTSYVDTSALPGHTYWYGIQMMNLTTGQISPFLDLVEIKVP
jgi:hypothetical protein